MALFPFLVLGQKDDAYEQRWQELNKGIQYTKSARPKGPNKEHISPQQFNEDRLINPATYTTKPSDDDIIYSREKRYKEGAEKGVEKHIKIDETQHLDDLTTPETDAPTIDPPDWDGPNSDFGDGSIFKYIFIGIALLLVVFLIYYFFFKNTVKPNQEINDSVYDHTEDINPETIEKNQLEIDLDKAIETKNYRVALRIYYILLLKALIQRNWIKWAKRKTNTHYLNEMITKKEHEAFNKAVNMYEWSWYGKKTPSVETFERFSIFYDDFLKRLKDEQ